MKTRVVFCWSDISGYMASCWREISKNDDFDVYVIAFQALTTTAFSDTLMEGVANRLLDLNERNNEGLIRDLVTEKDPDIVVVCGWFHRPYRKLVDVRELRKSKFVMTMDTPWQNTVRQKIGIVLLKNYISKFQLIVVTGERSWQYAKRLSDHVPVQKGMYGVDHTRWSQVAQRRKQKLWPNRFLFIGRYSSEKGIVALIEAYEMYREKMGAASWELHCCGKGEYETSIANKEGIVNHGFVQPADMEEIWYQSGVFILPSTFDPWPLALVEACAAGLPVICTASCGSAVELIRDFYNGIVVPPSNAKALFEAMCYTHEHHDELPRWGERGVQLAGAYSSEAWAVRWGNYLKEMIK